MKIEKCEELMSAVGLYMCSVEREEEPRLGGVGVFSQVIQVFFPFFQW